MRQRRARLRSLFVSATAALTWAACGGDPLEEDSASSRISVSLDRLTAAGPNLCEEADSVRVLIAPARGPDQALGRRVAAPGCRVSFDVTLRKGRAAFQGTIIGAARPLLSGSASEDIRRDGFVVVIDLDEIDALEVQTETIGSGGPTRYTFTVDDGAALPIGLNDTTRLAALAAGVRTVRLNTLPCVVLGGPEVQVPIPVDPSQLGSVRFEVDCGGLFGGPGVPGGGPGGPGGGGGGSGIPGGGGGGFGDLRVVTRTISPQGGYQFAVDGGSFALIGANDSTLISGFSDGSHLVTLGALPPGCAVQTTNPLAVQVSAGSIARAPFLVLCQPAVVGSGQIRVITRTVGSRAPAALSFAVDAGGFAPIAANDTVLVTVLGTGVPHTVTLAGVDPAACTVLGAPVVSVVVPLAGVVDAVFDLDCTDPADPTPAAGSIIVTTRLIGRLQDPGSVLLNGVPAARIAPGSSVTLSPVAAGFQTLALSNLVPRCRVRAPHPVRVLVPPAGIVRVAFVIDCSAPPPASGASRNIRP